MVQLTEMSEQIYSKIVLELYPSKELFQSSTLGWRDMPEANTLAYLVRDEGKTFL